MIGKLYRLALGVSNPVLVPFENRRLAREARGGSQRFEAAIEAAVSRGFEYFYSQEALEMAPLYVFGRILSPEQGPKPEFLERMLTQFRATWQHPNIRLLDPEYDPDARDSKREHVWSPAHSLEALMAKCTYADRDGLTEEFIDELAAIDDNGGFGTTHVIFGAVILKEFSNMPKDRLDDLISVSCSKLVKAQATDRAGNLFYERAAFLLWQGYGKHVDPAWMLRIVRAQREDGGWPVGRTWPDYVSKQHPSCLALASLILYRDRQC